MSVVVYKSTDSSAPTLDGSAGSLVAVLDACLVNGYGSKAAAGWSIAFTASNKRVYRMGSPSGGVPPRQMDLDVDDSGPGAATTQEARIRGYDQASGVGAGSNAFPASGTNICVRKSTATGGTARAWVVIADATTLYIFTATGDVGGVFYAAHFGEFYSYVSGDNYKAIICGRAENNTGRGGGAVNAVATKSTTTTRGVQAVIGNYAARNYAGLNIGGQCSKAPFYPTVPIFAYMGGDNQPYPNGADGAIIMSPVGIYTQTPFALHGEMRGFFYLPHPNTMASHLDTFSGSGALAGRTFIIISFTDKGEVANNGDDGFMCIETTDWPRST